MAKKSKKAKSIWNEIRTNYTEDETNITYVDAWLSDDDDENGTSIATIDDKGNVTYIDERAKSDKYAQEEIQAAVQRIEDARHELVDKVIERLKKDFLEEDYTVIDEILVHNVSTEVLKNSLPEE